MTQTNIIQCNTLYTFVSDQTRWTSSLFQPICVIHHSYGKHIINGLITLLIVDMYNRMRSLKTAKQSLTKSTYNSKVWKKIQGKAVGLIFLL